MNVGNRSDRAWLSNPSVAAWLDSTIASEPDITIASLCRKYLDNPGILPSRVFTHEVMARFVAVESRNRGKKPFSAAHIARFVDHLIADTAASIGEARAAAAHIFRMTPEAVAESHKEHGSIKGTKGGDRRTKEEI